MEAYDGGRRGERCGLDDRRLEGSAWTAGARKGVAGTVGAEVDGMANARR